MTNRCPLVAAIAVAVGLAPATGLAQSFAFSGAGLVSSVSISRTTASGNTQPGGAAVGMLLAAAYGRVDLELRYVQGTIKPSAAGGASDDFVEGQAVLGVRVVPWLFLRAGPRVRAYVTETGTERWVFWEARVRAEPRLLGDRVRTFAEVWGVLSGQVSGVDAFDSGQGIEGGLWLQPFGNVLWTRVGYRFDKGRLAGNARVETTEQVFWMIGIGGR